jgi:hypothetical protein
MLDHEMSTFALVLILVTLGFTRNRQALSFHF